MATKERKEKDKTRIKNKNKNIGKERKGKEGFERLIFNTEQHKLAETDGK